MVMVGVGRLGGGGSGLTPALPGVEITPSASRASRATRAPIERRIRRPPKTAIAPSLSRLDLRVTGHRAMLAWRDGADLCLQAGAHVARGPSTRLTEPHLRALPVSHTGAPER